MRRKKYSRLVKGQVSIRLILMKTIVVVSLVTLTGLWVLNITLIPALINVAEVEIKEVATSTIIDSINESILDNSRLKLDHFIRFIPATKNDPFPVVKYNRNKLTKIEKDINQLVQTSINGKDGFTIFVPIGRFSKSTLLANAGPKIPIHLKRIGESKTQIISKFEPVGQNTIHGEFSASIEMNVQLSIPFGQKVTTVIMQIPIAIGNVYSSNK